MREVFTVAVVGCGIGTAHAAAWRALDGRFELRAICDVDAARAEKLAQGSATYGYYPAGRTKPSQGPLKAAEVVTDFAELCKREDVEIIDICTPPNLHYSQCQAALAAGKNVVCEKPLVGSLKEVDELVAATKRTGKWLMPIFQYRFGHGLQKLKFLITQGLAGKAYLSTVETSWRRRAEYYAVPWRGKWQMELGGCLLGHAIHAHDGLYYALGPARSVFARVATRVNPIETEDCAAASLEMADGSLASLAVTLGSAEEISRLRFCFEGFVAESHTQPYNSGCDPWKFVGDTPELQKRIDAALAGFSPQAEGYEGQFGRLYKSLTEGGELPVTPGDARNALELVTAMYHSAALDKPVRLPLSKRHPRYASWLP